jgi:hypothetical protein
VHDIKNIYVYVVISIGVTRFYSNLILDVIILLKIIKIYTILYNLGLYFKPMYFLSPYKMRNTIQTT